MLDKPTKTLRDATFIGSSLHGTDEYGKLVKTSRLLHRWSESRFETENTIYIVEFIDGAEITIPRCWEKWPSHRISD